MCKYMHLSTYLYVAELENSDKLNISAHARSHLTSCTHARTYARMCVYKQFKLNNYESDNILQTTPSQMKKHLFYFIQQQRPSCMLLFSACAKTRCAFVVALL